MRTLLKYTSFLVLIVSLQSCVAFKDLEYQGLESYKVEDISLSGIKLHLAAKISNPNWFTIKAKGGELTVSSNGSKLGTFVLTDEVVLEKKSEGIVNIHIESKFKSLFGGSMMGLISLIGKGGKMDIKIEGHIKAHALGITKKIPISTTETIDL